MTQLRTLSLLMATVVALSALSSGAAAQQSSYSGQRSGVGAPIRHINIPRVFAEYNRYQAEIQQIQAHQQQIKSWTTGKDEEIKKLQDQLNSFNKGTTEYRNLEMQLMRIRAEAEADLALASRDLAIKGLKLRNRVYDEIQAEIANYASQNGVVAVLQVHKLEATLDEIPPQAASQVVMSRLSSQVVWVNEQLDITDAIVSRLNQRSGAAAPAGATSARPENARIPMHGTRQH